MSIWNGTMGIRFFYIPHEIAADTAGAEACLRGHGLPDIEAVADRACGWSGPDGLLDGDLSDGHYDEESLTALWPPYDTIEIVPSDKPVQMELL